MLEQFAKFISDYDIFHENEKILLAVSGGIDSMVMTDLFSKAELNFGIAHCNFQLRDKESIRDENFVKEYALKNKISFHHRRFNTEEFSIKNKISIQMAARDLRYKWFDEIRNEHNYDLIALAHNQDDVIETFMINLARGTGIRGLTGIKTKSGNLIRPMLFASRLEIENYQKENNIQFVEDSSNAMIKYKRNRIRHKLIPEFENLNPSFKKNILETIHNLRKTSDLLFDQVSNSKQHIISNEGENILINIQKLDQHGHIQTLLYEILTQYGFPHQIIPNIIDSLNSHSGKLFYSSTHRLVKDRENLVISQIKDEDNIEYNIDSKAQTLEFPIKLSFRKLSYNSQFIIPSSNKIATVDMNILKFPLRLRKWKEGDQFKPLGMKHTKKLSDFFIDKKLSIVEKENIWLLISNDDIVWVIGQRIDDRFKISENTKNLFQIEII